MHKAIDFNNHLKYLKFPNRPDSRLRRIDVNIINIIIFVIQSTGNI